MKLPESMTTVTTLSKTLAAVLFVTLPLFSFYLGIQFEKNSTLPATPPSYMELPGDNKATPSPTKAVAPTATTVPTEFD